MTIKSSHTLVSEALKEIKTITSEEALKMSNEGKCNLIDIREKDELENTGRVENSNHIPRGMLEFWLDPQSSYYKVNKFDSNKKMILFCALGMRSALSTKSLIDMGFINVAHVKGGFDALKQRGFEIIKKDKK